MEIRAFSLSSYFGRWRNRRVTHAISRFLFPVLLCLFAFSSPDVRAQLAAPMGGHDMPPIALIDFRLPNGLRVLLAPDHSRPVVAVSMVYNVGSTSDPENREGLAHLVEHLTFESGPHFRNGAWRRALADSGGTGNGSTRDDVTQYYETLPASQIDLALTLEAERLGSLRIDRAMLDHERAVVQAEWNERHQNRWQDSFDQTLHQHTAANSRHPHETIGEASALKQATLEEVQQFYATYYVPNNAVLAIAGDFDPVRIRARLATLFGSIAAGRVPPTAPVYAPDYPRGSPGWPSDASSPRRIALTTDRNISSHLMIAFPTVAVTDREYPAVHFIDALLSNGYRGRLWRELVTSGQAESVIGSRSGTRGVLWLTIDVTCLRHPDGLSTAERSTRQLIERFQREGASEDEMRRERLAIRSTIIDMHASPVSIAKWLTLAAARGHDPQEANTFYKQMGAVSAADVQRAAVRYLNPNTAIVMTMVGNYTTPSPLAKTAAGTAK